MQHRHRAGAFERLSGQVASSLLGHFLANQEEMLEKLERFFFPEYIRLIARLLPEAPADDGALDDDGQDDDGWDAVPAFAPSDEASGCGEPGEAAATVVNGESTAPDAPTAPRGPAKSGGAPWPNGPPATVDNGETTAGADWSDPFAPLSPSPGGAARGRIPPAD